MPLLVTHGNARRPHKKSDSFVCRLAEELQEVGQAHRPAATKHLGRVNICPNIFGPKNE